MQPLLTKFFRYVLTAGAAAVVDVGGFVLLTGAGMALLPAAVLSFAAAAVVNYLLTSRFVFARGASARGFGLFLAGALVGLAINVGVTVLAVTELGLPAGAAKLLGVGIAFLANFAINAGIVFRRA